MIIVITKPVHPCIQMNIFRLGHFRVRYCIGIATGHALTHLPAIVGMVHGDLVQFRTARAHGTSNKAFGVSHNVTPVVRSSDGQHSHRSTWNQAASSVMPDCLSRASTFGSRPRKALNSSMGSREPPFSRILWRNALPVSGSKIPFSSNIEKASAANTSAHL